MERRQIVAGMGAGVFAAGTGAMLASLQPALLDHQAVLSALGFCGLTGGFTTWVVLWAATEPKQELSAAVAARPPPPSIRPTTVPLIEPQGVADISLANAYQAVDGSQWAFDNKASETAILTQMADRLYANHLSAWGRSEPQGRLKFIPPAEWEKLRLDRKSGCATDRGGNRVYHDVQLNSALVQMTWPPEWRV